MYIQLAAAGPKPYAIAQLRRDNPQVSFPESLSNDLLSEYGVYPCEADPVPPYDPLTQSLTDGGFAQRDGAWVLLRVVDPLPESEAAGNIRAERDRLLAKTDWVVVKATETAQPIPTNWVAYRQALRDITGQAGFPYSVEWPTAPE